MTAKEAQQLAAPTTLIDDFETINLEEIYTRIKEAATAKEFQINFWGIIPDHVKGLLEADGYQVRIYNFPPQHPMTAVLWN